MAYWGYLSGVNGSVAPLIAESFGLGVAGSAAHLALVLRFLA